MPAGGQSRLGGRWFVVAALVWFVGAVVLLGVSGAATAGTLMAFGYPAYGATVALYLSHRRWPRIVTVVASLPILALIFSARPLYLPGIVLMLVAACASSVPVVRGTDA